jgi:hypothetical protein
MEYIKKEELKEGEIYKAIDESLTFIIKATKNLNNVMNIPSYNEFMKSGNFNSSYINFTNATPEQKHWLTSCITADKFITFEEAMKTFIPEYVECILQYTNSDYFVGKIYKVNVNGNIIGGFALYKHNIKRFKPSTKEAYDAQFVVKEVKVIKPLPQFKVIESVETITKVENNEGNQFFIGDVVKTEAGLHFKIIGFKYDENKTKILAIATDNYPEVVKDINDIEHYIEPKVEETLLEKAKRLYSIGTRYISEPNDVYFNRIQSSTAIFEVRNQGIFCKNNSGWVFYKNKWAEIINE